MINETHFTVDQQWMPFHLVEDAFTELATWQNCSSVSVGLELRIRSGLLDQTLCYDVDMKAAKHHG
jgi:hypothetical protein